jgi:ADP-dependent NAD(P)H-hydrate dehydratase / NAD(P)H-hydrate epimerase
VSVVQLDADYCRGLLPARPEDSHKGTFGTVVCVCGSLDYAGAALLSGTSAARGGTGLVGLALPASLQGLFAGRVPELITLGLPEVAHDIEPVSAAAAVEARPHAALVFGSGIRESAGYDALLLELLGRQGPAMVVDGGGLNLLSKRAAWWDDVQRQLVLTPHPGEFARLTDQPIVTEGAERLAWATAAASRYGQVVVLKGARTVVTAPEGRAAVSTVANAVLATAGSGDVLAGLIGSLIAQGLATYDAACLGVYLHARSGERLADRLGTSGVLASDLAAELPLTRRELAQQ